MFLVLVRGKDLISHSDHTLVLQVEIRTKDWTGSVTLAVLDETVTLTVSAELSEFRNVFDIYSFVQFRTGYWEGTVQ